ILDVPVGTRFVIDFGEGQLVTAPVRRSAKHQQGIEFEQTMVSDGNGGLCTRHRVSPYLIAEAAQETDRKSVVEGKSVSVRVDHGVSRIIKKHNRETRTD